jgi:hypothetical protein
MEAYGDEESIAAFILNLSHRRVEGLAYTLVVLPSGIV